MPPRTSLQGFLGAARAALRAPPSQRLTPLTFVIGNESADLDSLCSALLLAYLRTYTPPHMLHIPICSLPRDDLALHPEFSALLEYAKTSFADVITLSELETTQDLKAEDTRWLLVDHNDLKRELRERYGSTFVGCIDHHDDEKKIAKDSELRVIHKSGSCMSLVVGHFRDAWSALSSSTTEDPASGRIDEELAYLALAPILIDTVNLKNKDKTTDFDTDAVNYLESKLGRDGHGKYSQVEYHDKISQCKDDVSSLSVRDMLRKDYKMWSGLGTSSINENFAGLVEKAGGTENLIQELRKWADEKELGIVALLAVSKDESNKFIRELLVWAAKPEAVEAAREFERDNRGKLGLSTWGDGKLDIDDGTEWRGCWRQEKVENSRKQIGPMLRRAMEGKMKL